MYQSQKGVTASFCCVLFRLGKFSAVRKIIFSDLKQNCLMKRRLAFVSGQVSLFPAPQAKPDVISQDLEIYYLIFC